MFTRPMLAILCVGWFVIPLHAVPVPDEGKPKPGEVVEVEIAKGVKMKFCWVPAGKTTLGSPIGEKDRVANETEHEFTTKGFWMGKYPVTQEEWEAVMGNNPSRFSKRGGAWPKVQGMDTSRFPVDSVSWNNCQGFLKKMNEKTTIPNVMGKGKFALPHEDQWEYACRGGKGNKQPFYFGDELNGKQANCVGIDPYGTTTKGAFLDRTTEAGSYEKEAVLHPWGLCDMSGNVWQWCENNYDNKNDRRVLRGGSYDAASRHCRCAFRFNLRSEFGGGNQGFRVAVVP